MTGQTIQCVVMFADVAGSTAMYENLGDVEARGRISKALNSLISICKRHKGTLVKTIGDEILVTFGDVDLSLIAARAMQEAMEDDRSPETVGLSIRIGMHYGPIIREENDIYGDTVNVAARVVEMTKARQVLCTHDLKSLVHSGELTYKTRQYDRIKVKGKEENLEIYTFIWEQESEITNFATSNITNPFKLGKEGGLMLTYNLKVTKMDLNSGALHLGRGKDCNLLVYGDLISRYHAIVDVRRGKYVLRDQSTNGTYVRTLDGENFFLRQDELTLFGSGVISLGRDIDRNQDNLIYYSCD